MACWELIPLCCFCQAEDGIRDLVRSRGLGDVYKRQDQAPATFHFEFFERLYFVFPAARCWFVFDAPDSACLLYTSDAADERSRVDLGGRRIIKKKTTIDLR